jgi:hypothetical protein
MIPKSGCRLSEKIVLRQEASRLRQTWHDNEDLLRTRDEIDHAARRWDAAARQRRLVAALLTLNAIVIRALAFLAFYPRSRM